MSRRATRAYVAAVTVLGLAVFGLVAVPRAVTSSVPQPEVFGVLAVLLVLSEQFPVRIETRNGQDFVTLSTAFCCALLLHWDFSLAVLANCAAVLVNDLLHRGRWFKVLSRKPPRTATSRMSWKVARSASRSTA